MKPNFRTGALAITAVSGLFLAGCDANGGPQLGGGEGGGSAGFVNCQIPFGPGSVVVDLVTSNCLNCSVDNPNNLTSGDPSKFATINVTSVNGGIALIKAGFDDPNHPNPSGPKFPAGNIAGYVLAFPGLLEASVLPTFDIVTKLDNIVQEDFKFSGILGAAIASAVPAGIGTPFFLGVTTHKDFDAVEFKVTATGVSALTSVNLYEACGMGNQATSLPFILI